MTRTAHLALIAVCSTLAQAQMPKAAGARDLYFGGFEAAAPATQTPARKTVPTPASPRKNAPPAYQPVKATGPLGLRYSILKIAGPDAVEVPVNTRFQAGDAIQIKVQSNSDGFLYIVSQGTSGAWQPVFPSKGRTSNRVRAGEDYILPNKGFMRFAGKPGIEKLFVVLSRTPESDLESLIYNLKSRPSTASPGAAEPSLQIANNTIGDPLVSRLRESHTRDLVLEEFSGPATVTEGAPAPKPEKAMYVVSRNQGIDARVVADIQLIHQ
jgi:hypothetical protein